MTDSCNSFRNGVERAVCMDSFKVVRRVIESGKSDLLDRALRLVPKHKLQALQTIVRSYLHYIVRTSRNANVLERLLRVFPKSEWRALVEADNYKVLVAALFKRSVPVFDVISRLLPEKNSLRFCNATANNPTVTNPIVILTKVDCRLQSALSKLCRRDQTMPNASVRTITSS